MKKYENFIANFLISDDASLKMLDDLIEELGLDKCLEILSNLKEIKGITNDINPHEFYEFSLYEFSLSTLLFSLLRREENSVKAFLCNIKGNFKIHIEQRDSKFMKKKYYFKFPYGKNEFLYIRTHVYKFGAVSYYNAIKTLDFGDINLLFMHLDKNEIEMFSKNKNIIEELDRSRRLRNYVYHHNLLFSLGKEELKNEIMIVIRNLIDKDSKLFFINKLNNIKNKYEFNKLNDALIMKINEEDIKDII